MSWSELVAIIAIIGVLSALFLPTLARARAQAGQAICLANVRSVAQAICMYLAEHDGSLPPRESSLSALAYFETYPGQGGKGQWDPYALNAEPTCHRARQANPYLRWPVILDTYLPDRKVWQCPNARLQGVASFINGSEDWLAHLREHEGEWGMHTDPWMCPMSSWPTGWGGQVTDSLTQKRLAVPASLGAAGARAVHGGENKLPTASVFVQSIGVNEGSAASMHISEVADPAWYVICGDAGATVDSFTTGTLAYPDLCHLECAGPGDWEADWENCPWSRECGGTVELKLKPELRRRFARHFGGVNIGFLDGHAKWFDSQVIIAEAPTTSNPNRGHLRGFEPGTTTSDAWDGSSGIPPLY